MIGLSFVALEILSKSIRGSQPGISTAMGYGGLPANRDAHDIQVCGEDGVTRESESVYLLRSESDEPDQWSPRARPSRMFPSSAPKHRLW